MNDYIKMVVINDNVSREGLLNEWGWSAYIETRELRFLFDADTNPEVIRYNSEKLGIDLRNLDFAVLSHWHGDHYGGFEYVGRINKGLTVYVPPGGRFPKEWGLTPVVVREPRRLASYIYSTGPMGYYIREQAIGVELKEKVVVIVGCSHPGAHKLTAKIKELTGGKEVLAVIGGYHSPSKEVIDNLAELSNFICPAHCSGEEAKQYVKRKYPGKYCEVRTGSVVEFKGSQINIIY